MLELPQELLGELIMHEAERTDIVGARAALESALMFQYQTIAERLLADLLLRGGAEQSIFWQHYLTKRPAHPISRADFTNPDFVLFQDRFAQELATGRIQACTELDLNDQNVRVLGGTMKFWQDEEINAQLVRLGSCLRLIVVGSNRRRSLRLRGILRHLSKKAVADGRFILGTTAPVTAHPTLQLFEFERETAVSPFLPAEVDGFADYDRIAVRQVPVWTAYGPSEPSPTETTKFRAFWRIHRQMKIVHESSHVAIAVAHDGFRLSRSLADWYNSIRADICRFAQVPRSQAEIEDVFGAGFGLGSASYQEDKQRSFAPGSPMAAVFPKLSDHGFTFRKLLREMTADGLLVPDSGHLFVCPLYRKGQPWTPE
jgi:hypothetical protein